MVQPPVDQAKERARYVVRDDLGRYRNVVGASGNGGELLHRLVTQVAVHALFMQVDATSADQGREERLVLLDMPDETQTGQKVIYKQRELVIRLPREDEGVGVGVPETGDQEAPRPVDDACSLGKLSRVSGPDLGDPIPFDDHGGLGTRRRSGGIDDGDVRLAPPRAPSTKCLRVISLVRIASGPIRPENEPLSRSERRDRREKYDPGSGNRRGIPL